MDVKLNFVQIENWDLTLKPANLQLTAFHRFCLSAEPDIGSWYLKDAKEAGYESDSLDAFPVMKDNME